MWRPYAVAARQWLAPTDPVAAAAALAAPIAVHAGSLSRPATPTSAWGLRRASRPAEHLAEKAVSLFETGR